jgi:hypothetical protein
MHVRLKVAGNNSRKSHYFSLKIAQQTGRNMQKSPSLLVFLKVEIP